MPSLFLPSGWSAPNPTMIRPRAGQRKLPAADTGSGPASVMVPPAPAVLAALFCGAADGVSDSGGGAATTRGVTCTTRGGAFDGAGALAVAPARPGTTSTLPAQTFVTSVMPFARFSSSTLTLWRRAMAWSDSPLCSVWRPCQPGGASVGARLCRPVGLSGHGNGSLSVHGGGDRSVQGGEPRSAVCSGRGCGKGGLAAAGG